MQRDGRTDPFTLGNSWGRTQPNVDPLLRVSNRATLLTAGAFSAVLGLAAAGPSAAGSAPRIVVQISPIVAGPSAVQATGPRLDRPAPPGGNPALVLSVSTSADATIVQPLLDGINAFRTAHGLSVLRMSAQLARAAQAHVQALAYAGGFEHPWPDGQPFYRWIQRFYPVGTATVWSVGENLLWSTGENGSLPADQALALWVASPPHLHNLLTPAWQSIGIGATAAHQAGGIYGGADVILLATDFGARTK